MVNSVVLCGRLVNDPELRTTGNGTSVASFRLAVDDSRRGPNGEKDTVFINVSVFGKSADNLVKFTRKGHMLGVIGRLTQRKYVNRQNVEVVTTEVVADRVEFMEPKSAGTRDDSGFVSDVPASPAVETNNVDSIDVVDDDLPF